MIKENETQKITNQSVMKKQIDGGVHKAWDDLYISVVISWIQDENKKEVRWAQWLQWQSRVEGICGVHLPA